MEKPGFEENIRTKLEGHTSQPSVDGWSRLEGRLDTADRIALLRSRNMYRAIAASLAIVMISYGAWQLMSPAGQQEPGKKMVLKATTSGRANKSNDSDQPDPSRLHQPEADKSEQLPDKPEPPVNAGSGGSGNQLTNKSFVAPASAPLAVIMEEDDETSLTTSDKTEPLPLPEAASKPLVISHPPIVLPDIPQMPAIVPRDLPLAYKVADAVSKTKRPKKERSSNTPWLAVGYASGNYRQSILAGTPDAGASRTSAVYYGRNLGRLALFSGVALSEHAYNTTSNLAFGNASARKALSTDMVGNLKSTSDLSVTSTYMVNTQKRYFSVPVQAGWYVVDRKIKGMVSAGLMSDFFLKSTVSDVSGVYQSSVIRRGSAASYAGWVVSGLAGTEWSWGVTGRYQIALSPGIRYALTPVYRKDAVSNGKSVSADIGLRVRYFF